MKKIVALFTNDTVTDISPLGNGHINSTYCVSLRRDTGEIYRVVLQKINDYVFPDVEGLMSNICRVTEHLKKHLKPGESADRSVMTVLPSLKGNSYEKTEDGYYRCLAMIEDTVTYQVIENLQDFYRCAAAFADFHKRLEYFPADTLCETIVNFHNTESRFENLLKAVENNLSGRKNMAAVEIQACLKRKELASKIVAMLKEGIIPLRVIHNDTKLNNILFDRQTNLPLCIVDLDTVMPGAACYDFGDAIRSGGSGTKEDEHDLSKVGLNMELFEAYSSGYLSVAKDFLTDGEIESLIIAPLVITFENALRFLTDYLDGDVYFRTAYPDHNLYRCRTHLKLVEDMEQKLPRMEKIIRKYAEK